MERIFVSPPSEFITEDFLEPLNISVDEFVRTIDVEDSKIIGVLNNEYPITEEIAIALSNYLGCSVGLWLGIQEEYDKRMRGEIADIPVVESRPVPELAEKFS